MTTSANVLCVTVGGLLVALALVDVFYTVLFPGSGHGPVRRPLARGVRSAFHLSRHLRPDRRRTVLAYLGPVQVTATLVAWFVLLLVGWAAMYRPALGDGITAAQGVTDRSWGTALYFSGYDLTTLGLGDLVATTPLLRVMVVVEAATGFMTFTLAISYFVSVYGTLTGRNTFAMALHDRSGGSGLGVRVVQRLWDEGPVAAGLNLASMAAQLRELAQTHTAYPVLRSFHYRHDYAALPRILLTCWETVTLLRTTVDSDTAGRPELTGSAVLELEAAARRLTDQLDVTPWKDVDVDLVHDWRDHHAEAAEELRASGVPVRDRSVEDYVAARQDWHAGLAALSHELLYDWSGA